MGGVRACSSRLLIAGFLIFDLVLLRLGRKMNRIRIVIIFSFLAVQLVACVGITSYAPASRDHTLTSPEARQKADILSQYGKPNKKETTLEGGIWTYDRGLQWCGVTLWVLVPVPLGLPICTANDEIEFLKGQITIIHSHYIKKSGIKCGPFVNIFGFGMTNGFCL